MPNDRGHQPQRRRPHRPEPRAGPEPGFGPRRFRRPDRPRPAGREGTGRHLPRRKRDLAFAVHAGPRPVRPEPRRDAARPAGHLVRLGLASAARSATSPTSRSSARSKGWSKRTSTSSQDGDFGYHAQGRGQPAARRYDGRSRIVGYGTHYGGFIDAVGPAGGKNVNDGSAHRRPRLAAVAADRRAQDHAARRLSEDRRPTASTARNSTTSSTTSSRRPAAT